MSNKKSALFVCMECGKKFFPSDWGSVCSPNRSVNPPRCSAPPHLKTRRKAARVLPMDYRDNPKRLSLATGWGSLLRPFWGELLRR